MKAIFLFSDFYIYLFSILECALICELTKVTAHVWRPKSNLQELVLSFRHVILGIELCHQAWCQAPLSIWATLWPLFLKLASIWCFHTYLVFVDFHAFPSSPCPIFLVPCALVFLLQPCFAVTPSFPRNESFFLSLTCSLSSFLAFIHISPTWTHIFSS